MRARPTPDGQCHNTPGETFMTVMTASPPVGAISLEHVIPPKEYLGLELKKG